MSRHLQSWCEKFGDPLLPPGATLWVRVDGMPDVVAVALDMLGQADGHRLRELELLQMKRGILRLDDQCLDLHGITS